MADSSIMQMLKAQLGQSQSRMEPVGNGLTSMGNRISQRIADMFSTPGSQTNLDYQDGMSTLADAAWPFDWRTGEPDGPMGPVGGAMGKTEQALEASVIKHSKMATRPTMWPSEFAQRSPRVPQNMGASTMNRAQDVVAQYNLPKDAATQRNPLDAFMDRSKALRAIKNTNVGRHQPGLSPPESFEDLTQYESVLNNGRTPQQVLEQQDGVLPSWYQTYPSRRNIVPNKRY